MNRTVGAVPATESNRTVAFLEYALYVMRIRIVHVYVIHIRIPIRKRIDVLDKGMGEGEGSYLGTTLHRAPWLKDSLIRNVGSGVAFILNVPIRNSWGLAQPRIRDMMT